MHYAIYQRGGLIYGVGETPAAALDDASELMEQENLAMIAVPPMADRDNQLQDAKFYLAMISAEDATEVRVHSAYDCAYEIYSGEPRYASGKAFFKYVLELIR